MACGVRQGSGTILSHVAIQLSQHHLARLPFARRIVQHPALTFSVTELSSEGRRGAHSLPQEPSARIAGPAPRARRGRQGAEAPQGPSLGAGGRKGALEGEGTEGEEMSLSENEAGNGNLEWVGLLCPYQPCGLGQLSGPTKMVTTRLRRVVT